MNDSQKLQKCRNFIFKMKGIVQAWYLLAEDDSEQKHALGVINDELIDFLEEIDKDSVSNG